jgi:hypothetical protein
MPSDFNMIQALMKQVTRGVALAGLVGLTGCSTFNRDWQAAAASPAPTNSIAGRWEGQWVSDHNGHNGRLRALIRPLDNGQYEARYHAKYGGIFSFGMAAKLDVKSAADGQWKFSGVEHLGGFYGEYRYEGQATTTNFFSTYKASVDHGTFRLTRPR